MLTAYFDESGHQDDEKCRYVGMSGFVAPHANWDAFEPRWRATLRDSDLLEPFHMKEFAHSAGQFETWKGDEPRRRRLFGALIDAIDDAEATPIGAVVSLDGFVVLNRSTQQTGRTLRMVSSNSEFVEGGC